MTILKRYDLPLEEDLLQKIALLANGKIKGLKLSLKTTLAYFTLQVAPYASNGLPLLGSHLAVNRYLVFDLIKPAYFNSILDPHPSARNLLIYVLCETLSFVEQLGRRFGLRQTEVYKQLMGEYIGYRVTVPTQATLYI